MPWDLKQHHGSLVKWELLEARQNLAQVHFTVYQSIFGPNLLLFPWSMCTLLREKYFAAGIMVYGIRATQSSRAK